jgi:hypothetical protein
MIINIVRVGRVEFEIETSTGLGPLRVWRAFDRALIWSWVSGKPMPAGVRAALSATVNVQRAA